MRPAPHSSRVPPELAGHGAPAAAPPGSPPGPPAPPVAAYWSDVNGAPHPCSVTIAPIAAQQTRPLVLARLMQHHRRAAATELKNRHCGIDGQVGGGRAAKD